MQLLKVPFSLVFITVSAICLFVSEAASADAPDTIFYAATGEACCGEDPHAVHGIQTPDGGFVLSGKSLDAEGEWQGFAVKFPADLPSGTIWLDPEEEFTYKWVHSFGTDGKKDGANAAAATDEAVFVAGFSTNQSGVIDRYLAKLDLLSGKLIWETTFPDRHTSGESAIESVQITADGGLIMSGFVDGTKVDMEGFKSYGNPQSGQAFVLFLNASQVSGNSAPQKPVWQNIFSQALSGKSVKEVSGKESGYIVASSTRYEKHVPLVLRLDKNGKLLWWEKYEHHGELTDITVLYNKGEMTGFAFSGNLQDKDGGIDGAITKLTTDGSVVWKKSYGNPAGGDGIFSNLDAGNPKLIFDECWAINGTDDGGAVMACGTGIEECEPFEEIDALYEECEADPRKTWRSMLVRVNGQGNLIWQHVGSYRFPDENGEESEEVASSASEYVLITSKGQYASVTDLAFGLGLQLLDKD